MELPCDVFLVVIFKVILGILLYVFFSRESHPFGVVARI